MTNTYSGNEKGHVEKSVQVIRDHAFTKIYEFFSIDHAHEYLSRAPMSIFRTKKREQLSKCIIDYLVCL